MNRLHISIACLICTGISPYICNAIHLSVVDNPHIRTELYGYTKLDAFWDNQQMFAFRDDQFLVSPKPIEQHPEQDDPNDRGQFHFTSIESRLGLCVTDTHWSNTTQARARAEFDFFGVSDTTIATARLRHAYATLYRDNDYDILLGQTWHPLFITDCAPRTLGFDYGSPAEFQARAPQIRVAKHHNNTTYMFSLLSQQDPFTSDGPDGFETKYIRNAMMPEFLWRIEKRYDTHIIGTAASVKRLVPRIATDKDRIVGNER